MSGFEGEWANCQIINSAGYWYLQASLGSGGGPDADIYCEARCLSW